MACLLINGILKGCRDNIGGIRRVYLANKAFLRSVIIGFGSPDDPGLVTYIDTVTELGATGPAFYTFEPNKTSSNWSDTMGVVASNGGTTYVPSVTMVFSKNDSGKVNTIKLMGQSELVAIVENNDGKYFLLGKDNGLEISAGSYTSGTAYADLNGWTVTLSGGETSPSFEVDAALMTSDILI